jgi:hypothetical protein
MSSKEIKALARRFIDEWNKGEAATLAAMDELFAADALQRSILQHSGLREHEHH